MAIPNRLLALDPTQAKHETVQCLLKVLSLLDDIASSPAMMGCDDIERLGEARDSIARTIGAVYDEATQRHTVATTATDWSR